MYSRAQIRRGIRRGVANPAYFGRELNRLYHRRGYRRPYNTDGVDVVAEDWDNFVVLDACRFDTFADLHKLPGRLESRESRGSHTMEFLRGNFAGREMLDTVYVTASPQLDVLGYDVGFHAVEHVWDGPGWDDDAGTVRPETMADRTLTALDRYPDKRLVAHFVQPHYPFLGDDDAWGGDVGDPEGLDVWGRLMRGEADLEPDRIRRAYRRNLELALPSVERLLEGLPGRTVVSADHGNMFGERARPVPIREWGHPPGLYTEQLVKVPWLVCGDERRSTTRDPPAEVDQRSSDGDRTPREHLERLGYV